MPEVILPCPECGDDECLIVIQELPSEEWSVHCGCGHAGRYCATEEESIKAHNALPRALRWTHEPPKVAGPFFLRDTRHKEEAGIVHISSQQVTRLADKGPSPFIQYAGPIPSPID